MDGSPPDILVNNAGIYPLKDFLEIDEEFLEYGAFTTFIYGRVAGEAAEIEDHTNRGRNMDTRTAASKCRWVG